MNCQQRRIQIVARLDKSLTAAEERDLDVHIAGCLSCSRFQAEHTALQDLLAEESLELEPPARIWVKIQNQIEPSHTVGATAGWSAWRGLFALPAAWKPAWGALALMLALSLPLFTLQETVDTAALAELSAFQIEAEENPFLSEVIGPVEGNPFENPGGLK